MHAYVRHSYFKSPIIPSDSYPNKVGVSINCKFVLSKRTFFSRCLVNLNSNQYKLVEMIMYIFSLINISCLRLRI